MKCKSLFRRVVTGLVALTVAFFSGAVGSQGEEIQFRLSWKFGPENAPYYAAIEQGFFSKEGLQVKILEGSGSTDNAKLIGAGKIPIGHIDAGAVITGLSQDIPLVSVMVLYQKSPMGLVSMSETPIAQPSDLKGRSIGRNPKSVTSIGLDVFLKTNHIAKSDVSLVPVGYTQEPLLLKKVDMQTTFVNTDVAVLRHKGHKVNLLLFADWGLQAYGTTISTNQSVLKGNPELIRRFVRAARKGWAYTLENREKTAAIFIKYQPRFEREFSLNVLKLTEPLLKSKDTEAHGLGWQTAAMWEKTQDFYSSGGVLKKKVDVKKAFTNKMLQ